MLLFILSFFCFLAWGWLLVSHHGFWRAGERLKRVAEPPEWPCVATIIPARNEAASIAAVIHAHMENDYPGENPIILIDDNSTDGTADIARGASDDHGDRLTVLEGEPLAKGWSGKLWALQQGLNTANSRSCDYVLLTDADIVLEPQTLRRLVALAKNRGLNLASLMARLDARGFWGGLLIPSFIYFFQKLYPFAASNDPDQNIAAAAGGCMLVNADALTAIGGFRSLRGALIDDCALARRIKDLSPQSKTWIGLGANDAVSLRDNRSLSSIGSMVARSAYAQLSYSPAMLIVSIVGMSFLYAAPPVIALSLGIHENVAALAFALGAWGLMAYSYWPTLKLYEQNPWQATTLPISAVFYMAMTVQSAIDHWRGRGNSWKGRRYSRADLQ